MENSIRGQIFRPNNPYVIVSPQTLVMVWMILLVDHVGYNTKKDCLKSSIKSNIPWQIHVDVWQNQDNIVK